MKKLFMFIMLGTSLFLFGCGANTNTKNSNSINNSSEKKTLSAGESFKVVDTLGEYEFNVIEANYLGLHDSDDTNNLRLQVVWEINNISFKGEGQNDNGEFEKNIVSIEADDLKVKDDNGYVLDTMTMGWEGDMINSHKNVKIGDKMIKKYTWRLNNKNTKFITINFSRMENSEFKININR